MSALNVVACECGFAHNLASCPACGVARPVEGEPEVVGVPVPIKPDTAGFQPMVPTGPAVATQATAPARVAPSLPAPTVPAPPPPKQAKHAPPKVIKHESRVKTVKVGKKTGRR